MTIFPAPVIFKSGHLHFQPKSKYEEYRLYAERCLNLARLAASRQVRIVQREMAAEWLKLAEMFSAAAER